LPNRPELPPLYAILDADVAASRSADAVALLDIWLAHDIRFVQLRAKTLDGGRFLDLARRMAGRLARAGGTLIVNDRADIARLAGAHGVHVGQDDLSPVEVRRIAAREAVVGLSTHTEVQLRDALASPVDYVAVGPIFETRTKGPAASAPVGLDGVRMAAGHARAAGVPLVAIGGITLSTARAVLDAGARSVAVIADLLADDPAARAKAYRDALDLGRP
jgi:thiamine-phosphate pyrophosphorylase